MLLLGLLAGLPLCAQVTIARHGNDSISIEIGGKPFSEFHIGPDTKKPYLAPLRTAGGAVVTRTYPMSEDVPGEAHDHPHHRGLWFTHGDVNGYDFWGNEDSQKGAGKGKGFVVLRSVDRTAGGANEGTIAATFDWKTQDGALLLTETRRMTFRGDAKVRMIDFDITLKALQPVTFGDTKEGTLAMRLAAPLEEQQPKGIAEPKRTGKMVNAAGAVGEKNVWGKQSDWVDYSGMLGGETVGIAILDYPGNPRHPTYWHSRAYGLFAANPFGVHDFENDKTRSGKMELAVGQTVRFRYRVVIHPGDASSGGVQKLYDEYARR